MAYTHIPEQVVPGRRLGRHRNHDPRSLAYLAPAADLSTLKSVRHRRMIPVLDQGEVIAGINWYNSFDSPDKTGRIRIGPGATVRGGHEIVLDELDVACRLVWFTNSWSSSWGKDGRACIGWDDFARLLKEDGDVTVFVPLTQPAPTPTPPAPADPLAELAAMFRQWVTSFDDWFKKHGF